MERSAGVPDPDPDGCPRPPATRRPTPPIFALLLLASLGPIADARGDALDAIRRSGQVRYGSDQEGGGPYAFPDPDSPRRTIGFEVEMMAELARELGARPVFSQGPWDKLLQVLDAGRVDLVVNGYEYTESRARDYLATRPYYIYQLQLMAPPSSALRAWDDARKRKAGGGRWRIGVLVSSAAETFARESGGDAVQVVPFDGATDAMRASVNGQVDATLQDVPAALFYRAQFPGLAAAGPPVARGFYVIYVAKGEVALRDALDRGIAELIASGRFQRICERYGIWTEAQAGLADAPGEIRPADGPAAPRGLALIRRYAPLLVDASAMTILLSVTSMPLAMAIGLAVALGRMYGPGPIRLALAGYVELLRGTPLMLQLFVLFYVLKMPALAAGIVGLAINYSAYEAEIYRAGLQAVPPGQMEAALALGMSRGQAIRRVIVPQAARIVIPPVTNDFIALFKDTSVCSVVTLVELTKQYSILANSTGGVLEFAGATALIYLGMSWPLSRLSRWSEIRLGQNGPEGGDAR